MNKTLKRVIIGLVIVGGTVALGYLALVGIVWYQFNVGCGMDDGPFNAVKIEQIEFSGTCRLPLFRTAQNSTNNYYLVQVF